MSSKIAQICFLTLLIFSLATPSLAKYSGGTGEPNDPYLIATPNDLNSIGLDHNDWDKQFKMIADINLAGFTGTQFNIIGNGTDAFTGVFDGNGHEILNLKYESIDNITYFGLFGFIEGGDAEVSSLGVVGADVNLPNGGKYGGIGALVGRLADGIVSKCYASDCRVRARNFVGALVGSNAGLVDRCYSNAEVIGGSDEGVGGLVGVNGLVGGNWGNITESYSLGSVFGVIDVGGLVGINYTGSSITDCYSSADVTATCCYVGGLVSINVGILQRCYSVGRVNGGVSGGLSAYSPGDIMACFWDINVNPDLNGIGNGSDPNVVGLPTAQMQMRSTFADAGWEMVNIWDIGGNQTYPFLRTHLPSDINKDDETNFHDFAILAAHWLNEK